MFSFEARLQRTSVFAPMFPFGSNQAFTQQFAQKGVRFSPRIGIHTSYKHLMHQVGIVDHMNRSTKNFERIQRTHNSAIALEE